MKKRPLIGWCGGSKENGAWPRLRGAFSFVIDMAKGMKFLRHEKTEFALCRFERKRFYKRLDLVRASESGTGLKRGMIASLGMGFAFGYSCLMPFTISSIDTSKALATRNKVVKVGLVFPASILYIFPFSNSHLWASSTWLIPFSKRILLIF